MKKYLLAVCIGIFTFVMSACAMPAAPTGSATTVPASASAEVATEVPEEVVNTNPVVASDAVMTTTVTTVVEEVPVVLANVGPKNVVYPTLGGSQVMPFRDMGDGTIIVPVGYECLMTTDPFVLRDALGNEIASGKASVVLLNLPGAYRVETLVHPSGELKAHTTCSNVLSSVFVNQELTALSLNVSYEAGFVDLRNGAVMVVPTASVTKTVEVEVEVPAAQPSTTSVEVLSVQEVPNEVCVPEDVSFAAGYPDPAATQVVLFDASRWIVAGMDPATLNGVVYTDKVLAVVSPGTEVVVEGLGRGADGAAYMYACAYVAMPTEAQVAQHYARETNGGTRAVVQVDFVSE